MGLKVGLQKDASTEDEHHQEHRVPQLLQVLLQTHRTLQTSHLSTPQLEQLKGQELTWTWELLSPVQMTPCHSP